MYIYIYIFVIVMGWRSAVSHSPGAQRDLNAALVPTPCTVNTVVFFMWKVNAALSVQQFIVTVSKNK